MPAGAMAYLGDGAYVRISQLGEIVIYTTNGITVTNSVYLEPSAINELIKFLKREEMING